MKNVVKVPIILNASFTSCFYTQIQCKEQYRFSNNMLQFIDTIIDKIIDTIHNPKTISYNNSERYDLNQQTKRIQKF